MKKEKSKIVKSIIIASVFSAQSAWSWTISQNLSVKLSTGAKFTTTVHIPWTEYYWATGTAQATIKESGSVIDFTEDVCLRVPTQPIICKATATDPTVHTGCPYCGKAKGFATTLTVSESKTLTEQCGTFDPCPTC